MDGVFDCTDVGNADRLEKAFSGVLRHTPEAGWYHWDSRVWLASELDATHTASALHALITDEARQLAAGLAPDDDAGWKTVEALTKWAKASQATSRILAALKLLAARPALRLAASDLDPNPGFLNLRNGILNLDTLELLPHDSRHLCSNVSRETWDAERRLPWEPGDTPRFWAFLETVFARNAGMIQSIQQALGYTLSGYTSERCLFLCHGSGANGKSTLLNLMRYIMGTYARTAATETLMLRKNGAGVGDDLAALGGKRLVLASETEGGALLAESLVKRLTGGDPIACRHLYGRWFEFLPVFKIWLATNHKPTLQNTEPAIRARIRMIPFSVSIPREEQEAAESLGAALRAEAAGVLRWLVEGYVQWRKQGRRISWCREIVDASEEYFAEQDLIGQFLEECCIIEYGTDVKAQELYEAYRKWTLERGQQPFGMRKFGLEMSTRPRIERQKSNGTMYYRGVRLFSGMDQFRRQVYEYDPSEAF